ncbi:MAG: S41 family peptidase [Anaerolineales bacterium]
MKLILRPLALLPIILILLACRAPIQSPIPKPTLAPAIKNFPGKATSTLVPTNTPIPSVTLTPTAIPPSLTPTQILVSSPTSTLIPLNIQLSIFGNLWTIVDDTYVYPDFNGLDWNAIHQEYMQKISVGLSTEQFYQAMSELITRLGDDHSFFLDPQQVADQEAEYQGKHDYVGIGVIANAVPERHRAVILSVFPGSPAEAAGLQPRDSIISVDGTSILDENGLLQDIVRGPEGTIINVLVQTPGEEPRELHLTRHQITGDYPVVHQVITTPDGKRIGYILLVTFEDSTVDEQVAAALQEMTAEAPLDGLILDNKMNGGGSSAVFEPMLSYFVGGNLGNFISHDEQRALQVKLNDINGSFQVPLVALVGSGTASFGEIFSGILQDVGRAYLIGTTTDGNVEILWGYDLVDGSQLWLANETFRPLNHPDQDWEKTGIIPDVNVSGEFDQYTLDNDPAVLAALQYFSGQ